MVAAEVGRAKVLLYDELNSKAEKLVSPTYGHGRMRSAPVACFCDDPKNSHGNCNFTHPTACWCTYG